MKETGLSADEAERMWRIHGNEVLAKDKDFLAADRYQQHVGKVVGWSYAVLVAGLLGFMVGFYLWRFRFFWAIVIYVVLLSVCAFATRIIAKHSVKNDHYGELVKAAHDRYVARLMDNNTES